MSLKFETVKSLNVGGMEMIPIKTEDGKRVFVKTGKCFSFGVKKDKKFKNSISMSLVLATESVTWADLYPKRFFTVKTTR